MSSLYTEPKDVSTCEFLLVTYHHQPKLIFFFFFLFTQIEKLIHCQCHSSDLSHDFLAQVTALQRGEGDYRKLAAVSVKNEIIILPPLSVKPPKLKLSCETRVKLWAIYLPSFNQEVWLVILMEDCFTRRHDCTLIVQLIDLVKTVRSMGLSQSELDLVISARNVVC